MSKKILIILAVSATLLFAGCSNNERGDSSFIDVTDSGSISSLQATSYDWEDINIRGGDVEHIFAFKNNGSDDLYLKGAVTSCMCTTAQFELPDGKVSPKFGMHNNPTNWVYAIKPGEEFQVKGVFDPMKHGPDATGPITRGISVITSAKPDGMMAKKNPQIKNGSVTELRLAGNVLSEEDFKKKTINNKKNMPKYEILGENVLEKVVNKEDFVLIDVRENSELEESGIIEGAIHIPLGMISMDSMTKNGISKDDEIIVYCRSGSRSRQAYESLNALGFTNVKSMMGGTLQWIEDNRPLVPWNGGTLNKS